MIVIVDYGMGNLNSIKRKLSQIGVDVIVSFNSIDIIKADKLILPGVGHFKKAVENLKRLNLWDILNEMVLIKKKPVLGICLGMQLMAKHSEEGDANGLGWFDADVIKFKVKDQLRYKVPHIGWNNTIVEKYSPLFKDTAHDAMYYFTHSYYIKCFEKEDILTTTEYDISFTSSIQKDNIFGTQFHPEKSHEWGKKLLLNFINV